MFRRVLHALSCLKGRTIEYDWELEGSFRALYENVPVGFAITDQETGQFIRINPEFCNIVGYTADELVNMTFWDITPEMYADDEEVQRESLEAHYQYGPYEKNYIHKEGHEVPVLLSGVAVKDRAERPRVWSVVQDISETARARDTIYRLAYYDQLTGLPNRTHFINHAAVLIDRAITRKGKVGLMVVDIDDFKKINDSLGHTFGDKVLVAVAEVLAKFQGMRCEQEDDCECFCSRLGGDEFALMIENIETIDDIDKIAAEVVDYFKDPITVDDRPVMLTVSVGISLYPTDGKNVTSLLKAADLALQAAKDMGKNQHFFHNKAINNRFEEFFRYEHIIRDMTENGTFDVFFQPIYSLTKNAIIGAEALLRTRQELYGPLSLDTIIEVAEETGLIVELGDAIFRRACEECKRCDEIGPDRIVSVNVSMRQLRDPEFVDMFCYIMKDVGVNPHNLALEVTETMMMENGRQLSNRLSQLQDLGVHIFIDDFGKGYSSMTQLRHLPADKLKIDMEFIRNLDRDNTDIEIVRGINNLAQSLGLLTCAEGVETEYQKNVLRKLGVDQIQGYLIGRPVPAGTFKCIHKQEKENDT